MVNEACLLVGRLNEAVVEIDRRLGDVGIDARRALVQPGWADPIISALRPCLEAPHHASGRKPPVLSIGVYGGSMTAGFMNCHSQARIMCSGKHAPRHLAWPALLQKELQQHLPSCRVLVHNRATPANRVTSLLSGFKLRKLISTEDAVVITDFTINDNKGLKHLPSRELTNTAMGIAAAMEGLVRHVRGSSPGRQGPPALIQLESTRWPVVSGQHIGGLNLTSNWACVPATSNSSEDPHLGVTRHYGVPVISFVHGAACVRGARTTPKEYDAALEQHWRAGCGELDEASKRLGGCGVHPGPTTHAIFARLITRYILSHATFAVGAAAADTAASCGSSFLAAFASAASPTAPPAANSTFISPSQLRGLQGCSSSAHTSLSWEETCASKWQQSVLKNTGWACYEDRPGKPGLIANATGANIEFRMRVTSAPTGGDIVIGFLRSYANMGRVRIGIAGHFSEVSESDRTNTLDGLWASQTSQQDVAIISAVALARSHGNRTLSSSNHHPSTVRLSLQLLAPEVQHEAGTGRKFKVFSIVTC